MTIDMSLWQGRIDLEDGEAGARLHQKIQSADNAIEPGVMLVGFACDEGVSRNKGRVGAYAAPDEIRKMLANMPWHHSHPVYDKGNTSCDDQDLAKSQKQLAAQVSDALEHHHLPIVLGGGHEVAWGTYQGLAQHLTSKGKEAAPRVGIINFDAHFDLRVPSGQSAQGSSGTPFSQIADYCQHQGWPFHYACVGVSRSSNTQALFDKAYALSVLTIEDTDISAESLPLVREQLQGFMSNVDLLYLTIDIDVFPASTAPGVSAPAVHGVSYALVEALIRDILAAKNADGKTKLTVADVAELNPHYDIDSHTARLAARLVWTIAKSLSDSTHSQGVMK
ncbi:formimidoylglutamase [Enterovibrio sp. 27052020O]|uniref:formimidoylglutamase n=1 Tax=Enterovibrio sp. 27052020O TaxID=3241166 RepID=UPI00388EF32F